MFVKVCELLSEKSQRCWLLLLAILMVACCSASLSAQAANASGSSDDSLPAVTLSAWPAQPLTGAVVSPYFSSPDEVIAFGDSITRCLRLTDISTCYVHRLASYYGASAIQDLGISGSMACDVAKRQVFAKDSPSLGATQPLRTLMVGSNDVAYKSLRYYQSQFDQCDQSILAWLTTPVESKVLGASVLSGAVGSCAVDKTYGAAPGILCNAPGSAVAFSLTTTGNPIYLWFRSIDGDTGTYTYTVDNGPAATITTAMAKPIKLGTTISDSVAFLRIPAAAGVHTIQFVQTTAGSMGIVAVGTPSDAPAANRPYLLVADVPRQLDGLREPAVEAYGVEIRNNIQLLLGDGLNLLYVPVSQYLTATTAAGDMSDMVHPNALGHGEVFAAFLTQAELLAPPQFGPLSPLTLTAAVVPTGDNPEPAGTLQFFVDSQAVGSTPISSGHAALTTHYPLPVGSHQLTAAYVGNGNATEGTSPAVEVTITGQATSTRLITPAPSLPYGSSVKLAALVKSGGVTVAKGNVAFWSGNVLRGTSAIGSDGFALFTIGTLPVGTNLLSATFLAQGNLGTSTSPPALLAIAPISTATTLAASAKTASVGMAVALVANVSAKGLPMSSGIVTFSSPFGVIGTAALGKDGVARLTTSSLPAHDYQLKATFAAQGIYGESRSANWPLLITPAQDYKLSVEPGTITVVNGQQGTTSLLITPLYGFKSVMSFSIAGLPLGALGKFGDPTLQPNGQTSVPLVITTHLAVPRSGRTAAGAAPGPVIQDAVINTESATHVKHTAILKLRVLFP